MSTDRRGPFLGAAIVNLLEEWKGPLPRKAASVAFPLRKVVYSVEERQPLEIGLVERYVVEAASLLGPMPYCEIAELLGLDSSLVLRIARGLCGEHGALSMERDVVAATSVQSRVPHKVVTHDRAFAVAAVGGALLPANAADVLYSSRITATGTKERFHDPAGREVHVQGRFAHHPSHDGLSALRQLVDATPEVGTKYGLPLGLVTLGDRRQEQEEEYWIEAMLLISHDSCSIRPAVRPALEMLAPPFDRPAYVLAACGGLPNHLMDPYGDHVAICEEISKATEGATPEVSGNGEILVLRHKRPQFSLECILRKDMPQWIAALFHRSVSWHRSSGCIMRVMLGDDAAARASAAIRLYRALRKDASRAIGSPMDAWMHVVEQVRASCVPAYSLPDLHLRDAIVSLRPLSDSALQRALDAIEDAGGGKA